MDINGEEDYIRKEKKSMSIREYKKVVKTNEEYAELSAKVKKELK